MRKGYIWLFIKNETMNNIEKFKLQTGDIISTYTPFEWKRPTTYMAPFIRFFTNYKWTHTAVAIEVWGKMFICEAYTSGIIIKPLQEFPDGMRVTVSRPKRDINKKELSLKMLSKVSRTKYDILDVFVFQTIYQLTGKWYGKTKDRKAAKKFYCSEFVAWVYDKEFPNWYKTSPEEIHRNTQDFEHVYVGDDSNLK